MTRPQQKRNHRNNKNRTDRPQQSDRTQNSRRRRRPNTQEKRTPTKKGIQFKSTTATMLRQAENDQKSKTKTKNSNNRHQKKGRKGREKISDHFAKVDFLCEHCVESKSERKPFRISLGLIGAMEQLRSHTQQRIEIIKGFECMESNEIRKSFKKNYHTMGLAAVLQCPGLDLNAFLTEALKIDEIKYIIANYDDNTLYIDTRKEDEREVWEIRKKEKKQVKIETAPKEELEEAPKTDPVKDESENDAPNTAA